MIAIISSHTRERTAFGLLCDGAGWPYIECDSLQQAGRAFRHVRPSVVVTRYRLSDGYSDDVIQLLSGRGWEGQVHVVVLLPAGAAAGLEARQVAIGADVVHRDPVRADVIAAYLGRLHRNRPRIGTRPSSPAILPFAGTTVSILERTLRYHDRAVKLTPREVDLIQVLHDAGGEVVTYDMLYAEILGRKFRGETSNMRVLLGKVRRALRKVGIASDPRIEVIPKTGYRYTAPAEGATAD